MNQLSDRKDVLALTYQVRGLDRMIYDSLAIWDNSSFEVDENLVGTLVVYAEGITSGEQLALARTNLEKQVEEFVLALEWHYRSPLQQHRVSVKLPIIESADGAIHLSDFMGLSDAASCHVHPGKVPALMPQIPLECRRWIVTLTETTRLSSYVEEQLRRHYLIIEELWDEFSDGLDATRETSKQEIKWIRDFVSHPVCDKRSALVSFISSLLPSAIVQGADKPTVRFLRNVEHRNFVARYEVVSRVLATNLVQMKIDAVVAAANQEHPHKPSDGAPIRHE